MKKKLTYFLFIVIIAMTIVAFTGCLPKIATDKSIIGIKSDGLNHNDYENYKGYIYGNEKEKYNLLFRLALPENYNPENKYPMVTYLHWLGADGVDNETQMLKEFVKGLEEYGQECIVFIPQLPARNMAFAPNFYDSKDLSELFYACTDEIINNYAVDTDRLYITGVSMGAHNIWELLALRAEFYSAAMPVSFGTDKEKAGLIKKTHIRMTHAVDDDVQPVEKAREIADALKEVNADIIYKEYENGGHGIFSSFYSDKDTWEWLFSKIKIS